MINRKDISQISNEYYIDRDQLKVVGLLIRQARENKSISLESLANSLCIDKQRLIAIENAEKNNLPENVFIVGIIRRVANHLQINPDELISQLSGVNNTEVNKASDIENNQSKPRLVDYHNKVQSIQSSNVSKKNITQELSIDSNKDHTKNPKSHPSKESGEESKLETLTQNTFSSTRNDSSSVNDIDPITTSQTIPQTSTSPSSSINDIDPITTSQTIPQKDSIHKIESKDELKAHDNAYLKNLFNSGSKFLEKFSMQTKNDD